MWGLGWGLVMQMFPPQGALGDESKMIAKEASAQGANLLLVAPGRVIIGEGVLIGTGALISFCTYTSGYDNTLKRTLNRFFNSRTVIVNTLDRAQMTKDTLGVPIKKVALSGKHFLGIALKPWKGIPNML